MLSLIIQGGSNSTLRNKINELFPPKFCLYENLSTDKPHILTKEVNDLLSRLVVSTPKPRVVHIMEASKMTIPAQNALLKTLEEPPNNTTFILSLQNANTLLPTIVSRCQIITLKKEFESSDSPELVLIKNALPLASGERISLASSLGTKRDVLLTWTENCLLDIDQKLNADLPINSIRILTRIATLVSNTQNDLKANVSVSLTVQHLFLSLPHLK